MDKIIPVNYGLSSNYGGIIEINYKLYGDLKEKILKHEKRHSSDRHYTKEDLKNDFQSENSYFFESIKFCIKNPESFINFFPLMYSYYFKKFTYNQSAIYPFLYFGIIFSIFFLVIFKINLFYSFIAYTCFIVILNIFLLIWTHYRVKKDPMEYKEAFF